MKLWQYSCVACTWLSGWATTNAPGQCRVLNHSNSHRRGFRRLIGSPRLFPSPMRSLSKYLPPAFSYLCTCSIRCLWIPDYTSFLESSSLLRPFQLPLWLAKKQIQRLYQFDSLPGFFQLCCQVCVSYLLGHRILLPSHMNPALDQQAPTWGIQGTSRKMCKCENELVYCKQGRLLMTSVAEVIWLKLEREIYKYDGSNFKKKKI